MTIKIPDIWICARTSYWRKQGFNDKESLYRAIADWNEQAELEERSYMDLDSDPSKEY